MSTSVPGIGSSASRVKPSPGEYSSSRWIVVACAPVISASRRAALPVGAHRRTVRRSGVQEVDERAHRRGLAGSRAPVRIARRWSRAVRTTAHWASVGTTSPRSGARGAQAQARLVVDQRADVPASRVSTACIPGVEDAIALDDQPPAGGELVDAVVGVGAEQAPGALGQLGAGEMAVAVALGLVQCVTQPCVEPPRRVRRRPQRLRERVRRGEADPVELGQAVGIGAQRLDGARPVRAVDPRRHRGRHAVLLEEQAHGAQRALVLPRAHGRPDPRMRPMPGTSLSARSGSRSTTARTPSGPWRSSSQAAPRGPTCLTEPR